jgi:pimeloyl-ACP methyl ester carboxylesterase
MGLLKLTAAVVATLAVAASSAAAATYGRSATRGIGSTWGQEITVTASDNTQLACGLDLPAGNAPNGGWPGVIVFHGLGQSHADMAPFGAAFAQFGFAALACDARGTGGSGGLFGLDGPSEVQDAQDLYNWFSARPDVSDTQIGAFGLSLGGGEVWDSAVAGVPWKAIVPAITWTSLANGLNPDNVPKTGVLGILSQLVPFSNWQPSLQQIAGELLQGQVTPDVKAAEASRSSRGQLHSLKVPTLMLQGRHDFLFDMDQAIAAYKLLGGPKRLYLGDLGHAPAANPSAEQPAYIIRAIGWFGHYLAGGPKIPGGIELAHDPWDNSTTLYKKLPKTVRASVNLPGSTVLDAGKFVTRSARLTGGPHETFGGGYVQVRYSGASNWDHLVATISVKGSSTPITEGGAPIKTASGVVKIPLMNEAVLIKRGKKLVVTLGAVSDDNVNHVGVPIYASDAAQGASIKIGRETLSLSFLKKAVSK